MNSFTEVIQKISRGEKLSKDLTREEAKQALEWVFSGRASDFQIGAFFAALRMKGESAEETAGFVDAVRERPPAFHSELKNIVDFGEPYDGKTKTFHLTVPIALILAASGVPVVLHSTPEMPVKRGIETQRVLEALGVKIMGDRRGGVTPPLPQILEQEKIVFLPTEELIPDYAKLRPYREAFGLRPFLNHIEKIFNLSRATTQMVGIYHRPYLEPMTNALVLLGTPKIFVIQGVEGFTELFISRKTLVYSNSADVGGIHWLDPREFGLEGEEEIFNQDATRHAARILELLKGATGNARTSILWNAGVKLYWMNQAQDIRTGIEQAREILDSGKALEKLESFKNATQEKAHSEKI